MLAGSFVQKRFYGLWSSQRPTASLRVKISVKDITYFNHFCRGIASCSCYKGYSLQEDGKCSDINECDNDFSCSQKGMKCRNYMGSFYCSAEEICPSGSVGYYRRNGCCSVGEKVAIIYYSLYDIRNGPIR